MNLRSKGQRWMVNFLETFEEWRYCLISRAFFLWDIKLNLLHRYHALRSRWPLLILKVTRPKVKGRIMSAQYLKNPLFVTLLYLPWNGWVAFFFNLPYWGHINVSTTICFLLHCYEKSCVYWRKTLKSSCLMLYLHLLWYLNV